MSHSSVCVTNASVGEGSTAAGLHISHPDTAMTKKDCPAGSHWDSLVNDCVTGGMESRPEPELPTGDFHWTSCFFFSSSSWGELFSQCLPFWAALNQFWFLTFFSLTSPCYLSDVDFIPSCLNLTDILFSPWLSSVMRSIRGTTPLYICWWTFLCKNDII